jgi:hypothetical protein
MRYAHLSSVLPPVLPLHRQLRHLSHQMGRFRLTGRPSLLLGCHFPVSRGRSLPNRWHAHELLPSFKMLLIFGVLSLKFGEGICKTLAQAVGHATATNSLNGRHYSNRPRTRVRITYCSVSGSFSGIMLLIISILADRQRVECIAR